VESPCVVGAVIASTGSAEFDHWSPTWRVLVTSVRVSRV
jgi:hypothetical protein